jgi:hypothetical protein
MGEHVYTVCMFNERLQILVTTDQRRRVEREAKRRGTSVAGVIRDAVDAQLGGLTVEDRLEALDGIRVLHGQFASPAELDLIVASERDEEADAIMRRAAP